MKRLIDKLRKTKKPTAEASLQLKTEDSQVKITAMFDLLIEINGSDQLVLKAGKLNALHLMRSENLSDQMIALERLVYGDPTIERTYTEDEVAGVLDKLENSLAEILARRTVEESLERKINERVQAKHQEYLKEIRSQVLKEETGADNAQTLRKYAELEVLEQKKLSRSAMEMMRPTEITQVIGQSHAIRALLSKLSSPFPQHIILYGPPGVGKTTAARLALAESKVRKFSPFLEDAAFVEVDGTTLRWDPRDVTNPLLGSVHDPIYQGAKRELADGAIPEPKLGLVTQAHGGVLFIDEIGELDAILQNKLLKVLEDKRVMFDSAYFDPDDPNTPKYIQKLFTEGAPADFVLIGATTRDPSEINPALRSRCAEIFFDPLTPVDIGSIVENAAQRLEICAKPEVITTIADYTIEGRQATRLLADAYSVALYRWLEAGDETVVSGVIEQADITEVIQSARLTPYNQITASDTQEIGKIFGLGVSGFLGSVLELEAIAFTSNQRGKGLVRFNDTAGSMAKDSVFNAATVFRRLTGEELNDYDIHVNIVGGGKIDGPSAGVAIMLAMYSAIRKLPIPQDIAVTGEISLQGRIKPVGGVQAKVYGARQAGIRTIFIPAANRQELALELPGIKVIAVNSVEEIIRHIFPREITRPIVVRPSAI